MRLIILRPALVVEVREDVVGLEGEDFLIILALELVEFVFLQLHILFFLSYIFYKYFYNISVYK